MHRLIHREALQQEGSRTIRFEGQVYGSQISFFLVDNDPGQGPGLHVHPYSETWIVRSGEAEFTVGDESARAGPGDIVVVGPHVPHGFRNVGEGRLEVVCIHACDRVIQEWV